MNPILPNERDEVDSPVSKDDESSQSSVTLPASAFASTPKEGQRLTFCVTGGDEDGVTGYWMADEPEEKPEESWEDAARNSIKPPEET